MKEFTDEMDREVTFKNRLESFKKNVKDYFEYDYKNKNGGEDPWEICLIRDGNRIASLSEELINRQKAENEDLKKENEALKTNYQSMCMSLSNMAKVERRKAIKEFWNNLKFKSRTTYMRYKEIEYTINYVEIAEGDDLVKEMTEGK